MDNCINYYEVEFKNSKDPMDTYSICIRGKQQPTIDEATNFCKSDMETLGYDIVSDVLPIPKEEAYMFFDMDEEDTFPVFERK